MQKPEDAEKSTGEFGPIASSLVGVPLLAVAAAISVPVVLIWGHLAEYKQRKFGERMSRASRTISFDQFSNSVREGKGTMILEYRTPFKGPVRPWWTAEDVYARAPYPCVDHYHMWKDSSFRPFLDWLDREYLSPIEGRAFFVVSTAKQRQSFRAELKNARSIEVPTVTREGW